MGRKRTRRQKPQIAYPPLQTKKWIPPSQRKIKPRKKLPPYPPVLHTNLEISSLKKIWHNYKVVRDAAILLGNYSMSHHRYSYVSNGFQGSAMCVVAILYSKILCSDRWSAQLLDTILDVGDHFYLESKKSFKFKQHLKINELSREIYIHNFKITIDFKGKIFMGLLYNSTDGKCQYLYNVLLEFFSSNESGVVSTMSKEPRFFAVWKFKSGYFLFDPSAHNDMCWPWQGIPGGGVSILVRFSNLAHLLQVMQRNLGTTNVECELVPIGIERIVFINTRYPICMKENRLEEITALLAKLNKDQSSYDLHKFVENKKVEEEKVKIEEIKDETPKNIEKQDKDNEDVDEQSVVLTIDENDDSKITRTQALFKKPRVQSITFFNYTVPERIGIICAETHQDDPDFQKCPGKHAICNAIAALTMLRQYKSKYWTPKIVNNVLRLGYRICIQSKRQLNTDKPFNIMNVTKMITLEGSHYTPVIIQYAAVGKLRSTDETILDLHPALKEVFKDYDNIVLQGPSIVSVWKEDDYYYMFDPEERDPNGLPIIKEIRTGSLMEPVDYISGTACLLQFNNIGDLVEMYLKNVPRQNRRDIFVLSNVQIKDYEEIPENWGNFIGIAVDRWILRGDFSQADLKFEKETRNFQCIANCVIAISYTYMKPIVEWNNDTMNTILNKGNQFYLECIEDLLNKNKYVNQKLILSEILQEFLLNDKLVCVDFDECFINGYISTPDGENNLLTGLQNFFKENDYCIVSVRGIAVALWKKSEVFYYFDSHDRDEFGYKRAYGTSCIQRILTIERLAECILTNLDPNEEPCIYNINRISLSIYEPPSPDAPIDEDDYDTDFEDENENGITLRDLFNVEMPLYNYTKLTKKRAILRGKQHQGDVKLFGQNAGKQTMGNLIAAVGMAKIFDPKTWDTEIMGNILKKGDDIYKETMEEIYEKFKNPDGDTNIDQETENPTPIDLENIDKITTDNIKKVFKIGINKFSIDFEELGEGIVGDSGVEMKKAIKEVLQDSDDEPKEIFLKIDDLEVVLWKQGPLYYLFDPKARDEYGDIYGKTEWSALSVTIIDDIEAYLLESQIAAEENDEEEEGNASVTTITENTKNFAEPDEKMDAFLEEQWKEVLEFQEEENEENEDEGPYIPPKHSDSFWKEQETNLGRAYVMWSTKLSYLLKHIIINIPPKLRNELTYSLKKIIVLNVPEIKDDYNEEEILNCPEGDWNEFKEITNCQWILRGTMYQNNRLFPENNRGKQSEANCLIAIAYACMYQLSKFDKYTVDAILKYGDRLLTSTKKLLRKELQKSVDPLLKDIEIDEIIKTEDYTLDKLIKTFCIGDDTVSVNVEYNFLIGELKSKFDEFPDIPVALESFFESGTYGIFSSKGTAVAFWKTGSFYYMFDPCSRGPSGRHFENGVACITRFLQTSEIAQIISENLPLLGKNFFTIHLLKPEITICYKPLKVEQRKIDDPLKIVGFSPLIPGKFIIRGRLNLDHPSFGRGTNMQGAPIATVALAMTLIHNCEYWTAPIIDEIIIIGDRIYGEIVENCEYSFNPWEEKLTISMTPKDFKIGKIKVNFEIRNTEQVGVVEFRETRILRLAIENFFNENCYGVLDSDFLTVAIWQGEDDNKDYIYMFDPYSRSQTGQIQADGGSGCVVKCNGSKLLADHIISLSPDDGLGEFTITPIEIVVERDGKCKKTKNYGMKGPTDMKSSKLEKLGRHNFYTIPNTDIEIIRGTRSQNHKNYSETSRGNQDVPNCIISYVMDKLIPLDRWNYKIIDMLLDIGDQLYKDSYIIYNPKDKKLRLETLIRDIIIRDVCVKISVGAPVLTAKFTSDLINDALSACFNLKSFCIILVNENAVSLFKKDDAFYLFYPGALSLEGSKCQNGSACVLKIPDIISVINFLQKILVENDEENEVFHIIVVGVREIQKLSNQDPVLEEKFDDVLCQ